VGDASLAAILAALDMSPERRHPSGLDRGHDLALIVGEPVALRGAKTAAVARKCPPPPASGAWRPAIRAARPRARVLAGGINAATCFHSSSVISLG
jgi:hypothetical protein